MMLQELNKAGVVGMNSRLIADLTGKQHKNVLRDIRVMLEELEIDECNFEHTYEDSMNRAQTEYILPRLELECLLTGYSVKLRMAVLSRMKEMEESMQHSLPTTFPEALRALADLSDSHEKALQLVHHQTVEMQEMQDDVDFVAEYVDSDGLVGFREVAKLSGINERKLRKWLLDNKVLYRLHNRYAAHSIHMNAGRFEDRTTISCGKVRVSTLFTAKGVKWILKEMAE